MTQQFAREFWWMIRHGPNIRGLITTTMRSTRWKGFEDSAVYISTVHKDYPVKPTATSPPVDKAPPLARLKVEGLHQEKIFQIKLITLFFSITYKNLPVILVACMLSLLGYAGVSM